MSAARGAAVAGLAIAASAAGRPVLLAFMIAVGIVAAGESLRRARARGVKPAALVAFAAIGVSLWIGHARADRTPALLPAAVAAALGVTFLVLMRRRARADVTRAAMHTILPVVVLGGLGSYVPALRATADGFRLTFVLVLMVAAAEGGRRLHAHLRPGRAWEPAAGGLAASIVVGASAALWVSPPFAWGSALVTGALVGAAAPIGRALETLLAVSVDERPAPRAPMLEHLGGLVASAPVFFYAFRALAR